jgi:hypothetical protein
VTDDVVRRFDQLRVRCEGLSRHGSHAAETIPVLAEGVDRTGSVRAEVGPDGLPIRFQVAHEWERRLRPAGVGPAVVEAWQAGTRARLAAWASGLSRPLGPPRGRESSERGVVTAAPRPLEALADDLVRVFDQLAAQRHLAPAEATGRAGNDRLTLTLTPTALLSCTVEVRWAVEQSGARLTTALNEALAEARAQLPVSAPDRSITDAGLDTLACEALELLADQGRPAR